jgi:hypothetical protein
MLGLAAPVVANRPSQPFGIGLRLVEAGNKVSDDVGPLGWQNFTNPGRGGRARPRNRRRFGLAQILGLGSQELARLWKIAGFGIGGHGAELAIIDPSVAAVGFGEKGGAEASCPWAKASRVGWLARICRM